MVFYPDGSTLIGTGDDGFIRIWSLPEGRLLKESAAHKKPILGLALNPDTQTLYTAGFDRKIKAWSLDDLSLTDTWEVPGGVTWLTLSPDNTRLAVSLLTKQAVILDADTGEPLTTLSGHTKPVSGIVFFPDSARTATTSLDGSLRLFDKNGALVHILTPENPDKMTTLAINPQNPSEVWSGGWFNHLWVWDITEPALSRTITASFSPVFSLDLSRDGRFLAAGSQNTGVAVWQVTEDPVTGVPAFYRHTFQDQTIPCWSLALHPDQPVLAYTDTEGFIHVLDLATNEFLHHTLVEPMIPSKIIKRLEIDPSGEVLAASDASKVVMLRLSDMAFLRKIGGRDKKKGKPLGTSHFIPEPSLLMAGIGHTVQFFDSTPTPGNSGARFTIDTGMPGVVTALAVSSDQRFLAAMNSNGELQVRTFSLENESRRLFSWQLTDREGENCQGKNLVFSKDSRHLIAGTETGDLVVYHLLETDPVHHISAHPGGVNALEISPDGRYLYSAGEDSVVRVWSWPDLTLHSTLAAGPNGFAEERH
jgi:WD40 repeat protein